MNSIREAHWRKLERMYSTAEVNAQYAPELRIEKDLATLTIAVRPGFFHAGGSVHGSIYFKMLDDAAFFAASSRITDYFLLTASFNVHFHRPVKDGQMIATGQVVSRSRRIIVAESILLDDCEREIARGSGTFMPSSLPLNEELGYR